MASDCLQRRRGRVRYAEWSLLASEWRSVLVVAAQARGYETFVFDSCVMDAAGPFPVSFAAEHRPDLLVFPRALYERHAIARPTQARVRAPREPAAAAQQVDVDRLMAAAKRKQLA